MGSAGEILILWDNRVVEKLDSVVHNFSVPWCVLGDFNVVCFPSERLGCNRLSFYMMEFSDFIDSSNLVDLPLGLGPYT